MVGIDLLLPRSRSLAHRDLRVPLVLVLLVVTGAGLIFALARHLSSSGRFEILGVPFPPLTYGPAFVALIAPIFRIAGTAREAYELIRGLNALIFATSVIPAFLIAVRALSRRSALIVSAVTIVLPASVYATKVMTESLAFAFVLWSV